MRCLPPTLAPTLAPTFALTLALILPALSARAETARLDIFVQETDPLDFVLIRNVEGCGPVTGTLVVDFRGSVGQVVVDTEPGGLGTQQFAPVQTMIGPARPMPVPDGAQQIAILIAGLAAGEQAVVTMDLDSEGEAARAGRIVATAAEMAGSRAVFTGEDGQEPVAGLFGTDAAATLMVPADCAPPALF